jgi:hypothetical protein
VWPASLGIFRGSQRVGGITLAPADTPFCLQRLKKDGGEWKIVVFTMWM